MLDSEPQQKSLMAVHSSQDNPVAVILAAGEGSRLSSLTSEPKCLLQINGKTLLQWHLSHLKSLNISEICMVVGYRKERIKNSLQPYEEDFSVDFVENNDYKNLGNGYSLWAGLKHVTGDVVIFDADVVYRREILANFLENSHKDSILVGPGQPSDIECTKTLVDRNGRVHRFVDKRAMQPDELSQLNFLGEAMGIIRMSDQSRLNLTRTCEQFFSDEQNLKLNWEPLFNIYLNNVPMYSHYEPSEDWIEIDTPEDYQEAVAKFKKDRPQQEEAGTV